MDLSEAAIGGGFVLFLDALISGDQRRYRVNLDGLRYPAVGRRVRQTCTGMTYGARATTGNILAAETRGDPAGADGPHGAEQHPRGVDLPPRS